jgi:putative copper resistance protein D
MTTSLLILSRFVHFGSGMILVGVVAFRWLILLPAFAGEPDTTWQAFMPLVVSGLALFWAVSAGMSDSSLMESLNGETLGTVFFQTQFGSVCQWRIGLAVVMAIMMWWLQRMRYQAQRRRFAIELAAGLTAIALMVSLAGTGHAAATGGADFWYRVTADALHLFAASVWPTGLLPFALFLTCASRITTVDHLGAVAKTVNSFSNVSLIVVVMLTVTGIVNAYFLVGSLQALWGSSYGQVLCLKLFLFTLILGLAAWNRFHLLPHLIPLMAKPDPDNSFSLLQRLRNFVLAEFSLAVGVIMVVAFLGTMPPPR